METAPERDKKGVDRIWPARIANVMSECFFGLLWAIVIALLVLAPGVISGSVDFIYANF